MDNSRRPERRQSTRVCPGKSACVLLIAIPNHSDLISNQEGKGVILNLSVGGCQVDAGLRVSVHEPYRVILQLSASSAPIFIDRACIIWKRDTMFGLNFQEVQPSCLIHLHDAILNARVQSNLPPGH